MMTHPNDTCYHILLAEFGGTPIQTILDTIEGQPFGFQLASDQSGTYIVVDCRSGNPISSYPELNNYIPESYPSWITDVVGFNPENSSWANANALVNTVGASGAFWKALREKVGD